MFDMNSFDTCVWLWRLGASRGYRRGCWLHETIAPDDVDANRDRALPGVILTSRPGPVPSGATTDDHLSLEHFDPGDASDDGIHRRERAGGTVPSGHCATATRWSDRTRGLETSSSAPHDWPRDDLAWAFVASRTR